jgi:Outer membrane protein beta-barrel domain
MHNLSDNDLDRLLKDAAEHYQAPKAESLWAKIAGRLDREMPHERKYRRRIAFLFLLLLLLAGGGTYYLTQSEKKDSRIQQTGKNSAEKLSDKTVPLNSNETIRNAENQKTVPADLRKNSDLTESQTQANPPGQSIVSDEESNTLPGLSVSKKPRSKDQTKPSRKNENKALHQANDAKTYQPDQQSQKNKVPEGNKKAEAIINEPGRTIPETVAPIPEANSKTVAPSTPAAPEKRDLKKKQSQQLPLRKWEIGVVYSPDLSNVEFSHSDKAGFNLGITLGYNFNRRWAVNTGFIYTKKNYTTSGDNYKFPPNYWANNPNIKIEQVRAICSMIDIPINVRYNWLAGKRDFAFVSAGLSSYLMNKEEFHYDYTYYNSSYYRKWTNGKDSNYFLSIANFSIGYERQVSPSISLQAEPFFKFSLKEVGFGNVDLNSLGMFVGVKYKPSFGKKAVSKPPVLSEK